MSIELVRKPASASFGGEITTDSGQQYPSVARQWNIPVGGPQTFSIAATGNAFDNHGLVIQRSGGAVAMAIGYRDDVIQMYIGTTTSHPFAIRTADVTAATVDATQTWTFGPATGSGNLLHQFNGGVATGFGTTTGNVNASGPNGGVGTDTANFPYFYNGGWASSGSAAHAQYVGNGNSRYWGIGSDTSSGMVMGTVNQSSGQFTSIQAVMSSAGAWTLGTASGTVRHSINGPVTINASTTTPSDPSTQTTGIANAVDFIFGRTTTTGSTFGQGLSILGPTVNGGNPTGIILQTVYSSPGAVGTTSGRLFVSGVQSSGGYDSQFEVWLARGVTSSVPIQRLIVEANSGTVTMSGYGAGTASFGAGGVLTTSSDSRLKDADSNQSGMPGLAEVMRINPLFYYWKSDKDKLGDAAPRQLGFYAQDFQSIIPEAVGQPAEGSVYYGLYDRPIIAALVNAMKELKTEFDAYVASHP